MTSQDSPPQGLKAMSAPAHGAPTNTTSRGNVSPTASKGHYITLVDALTYALIFFGAGVEIAPCQPGSKSFVGGYGPHLKHIETDVELYNWLVERKANYALLTGTGERRKLAVLDFDDADVYRQWRNLVGEFANSFTVATSRGCHVYFWTQDTRSWRAGSVEVMGLGKAVMGPGSVHPSGLLYIPLGQPIIRDIESLADFPLLTNTRPALPEPARVRPDHLGGGTLAQVKTAWHILNVIQERPDLAGRVRLKSSDGRRGRWYAGFCPFHDDRRKPSFWVDAERDLFGCRACDARGDVINFVARLNGWKLQEAIRNMARGQG